MEKTLIYQIYLYCLGSIKRATEHLRHCKTLGVDVVWLGPLMLSPGHNHGDDVSDYLQIDPKWGTMADFREFLDIAHQLGIKVIVSLPLNHTSIEHPWFTDHPEYYWLSRYNRPEWKNLLTGGPAYWRDGATGKFHLSLFHPKQADLKWFSGERLNRKLVAEFQRIIKFWLDLGVDGFHLGTPQALNKDRNAKELTINKLHFENGRAIKVINALFPDKNSASFLMVEVSDPTFGGIVGFYTRETAVSCVTNGLLLDKYAVDPEAIDNFEYLIQQHAKNTQFALHLESHDTRRWLSRSSSPDSHDRFDLFIREMDFLFWPGANVVILYNGQELGLFNPTEEELPYDKMLELDARSAMIATMGGRVSRGHSSANARTSIPAQAFSDPANQSCLKALAASIEYWRNQP